MRIQLLKTFAIEIAEGERKPVRSARLQSLLAYLLLHRNAAHSRQQLAYQLWPESEDGQARTNLRNLLHQLRRSLPDVEPLLLVDDQSIQWQADAPIAADFLELQQLLAQVKQNPLDKEALRSIVDEYDGELLPSCYDDWIVPIRRELQAARKEAFVQLLTLLENQRAYKQAIPYARRYLDLDPLDEEGYRRLMRLQLHTDDRSGAVQTYRQCAAVLQEELGVEPGLETERLYEQVQDPDRARTVPERKPETDAPRIPLIGRRAEWEILQQAWQEAVQGDACLVVISGVAGIGKTRLAEELLHWVRTQGAGVARTRSYAAQDDMAYAPIVTLLRAERFASRIREMNPAHRQQLVRILPELLEQDPDLEPPGPMMESWQRFQFLEVLTAAVSAGEQPLLLHFDDLHWSDEETLSWIHYLLQNAQRSRTLVTCTVRGDEVDRAHALTTIQHDLQRSDLAVEIPLQPLSRDETAALAAQIAQSPLSQEEEAELLESTEGNPLFIVESVRGEAERAAQMAEAPQQTGLPTKVYSVIQYRLSQVSADGQQVLNIAAAVGREFDYPILMGASSLQEEALIDGIDELLDRQIIREQSGEAYDFSHDRLRDVVYANISRTRRRHLHRQIARAIEGQTAGRQNELSSALASHWAKAGDPGKGATYFLAAGKKALGLSAYAIAIDLLSRGRALLESVPSSAERDLLELDLLATLGTAHSIHSGASAPEVEDVYERARALVRRIEDSPALLPIYLGMGTHYLVLGELTRAGEMAERMLDLSEKINEPLYRLSALYSLGAVSYFQGSAPATAAYLEHTLSTSEPELGRAAIATFGYNLRVAAAGLLAITYWLQGRFREANAYDAQAIAEAEASGHPHTLVHALHFSTILAQIQGDVPRVLQFGEQVLALAEQHRFTQHLVLQPFVFGWALAQRGESRRGIEMVQKVLGQMDALGLRASRAYCCMLLADALRAGGRNAEAVDALDQAFGEVERNGGNILEAEYHRLMGELFQQQGRPQAEVEQRFARALQIAQKEQTKTLELKAALDLAALYEGTAKAAEYSALVASLYTDLNDGVDHPLLDRAAAFGHI